MIVIGLTGSIAMGKSETARMFHAEGLPVFDADAAVHALYAPGGAAVPAILARFPGCRSDQGGIDRTKLSLQVVGHPAALRDLEALVHPLVRQAQDDFLRQARKAGKTLAVIDHPLLFESGADQLVDVVVVVSAPAAVQRKRALVRPGMTAEKLDAILARQLPDADKRARADFIVDTSQGLAPARAQVAEIVSTLMKKAQSHA